MFSMKQKQTVDALSFNYRHVNKEINYAKESMKGKALSRVHMPRPLYCSDFESSLILENPSKSSVKARTLIEI